MRLILIRAAEAANIVTARGVACTLHVQYGSTKVEARVYVPVKSAPQPGMAFLKDVERTPEIDAFVLGIANEFQLRCILREFTEGKEVWRCPTRML